MSRNNRRNLNKGNFAEEGAVVCNICIYHEHGVCTIPVTCPVGEWLSGKK